MSGVYDSEEDIEAFNVTNDDLANEFDPDRPIFRQTKEDALYGMWARQEESGWRCVRDELFIFQMFCYAYIEQIVFRNAIKFPVIQIQ